MKTFKIFAINPGSTSTKIALFENDVKLYAKNVKHDAEKLKEFKEMKDQFPYRKAIILEELEREGIRLDATDAFVGRGGALASVVSGTYELNEQMLHHARICFAAVHPASLGPQLAEAFMKEYGGRGFTVNPPGVDEFSDLARVTGMKGIYRQSRTHALNQKEVGIRYAQSLGRDYADMNLIIAHIGGGVSVVAHQKGKMVDSNDVANGDGPMAPTRSGAVAVNDIIRLCFSGEFTEGEMKDRVLKKGGLVDHLDTSEALEVRERMDRGDTYAKLIYDAMIYQIGKTIGSMAVVLKGKVDAVILTGGISNDAYLVDKIRESVGFLAPVEVRAGEFEMEALAAGALRVLTGQEQAKVYTGLPVWSGF